MIRISRTRVTNGRAQSRQSVMPQHGVGKPNINRIVMLRAELVDQRLIRGWKCHIDPPAGVGKLVRQDRSAQHMLFARGGCEQYAVAVVPDRVTARMMAHCVSSELQHAEADREIELATTIGQPRISKCTRTWLDQKRHDGVAGPTLILEGGDECVDGNVIGIECKADKSIYA